MVRETDRGRYVPILKANGGGLDALAWLPNDVKSTLTPLVELHSLLGVEEKTARSLRDRWPERTPFYVDLLPAAGRGQVATLAHAAEVLRDFAEFCRLNGLLPIPTTGPGRPDDYQDAVRDLARRDGRGALIRLPRSTVEASRADVVVDELLEDVGQRGATVDLLIDVGEVDADVAANLAPRIRAVLGGRVGSRRWRSRTVAAGAAPRHMGLVANFDERQIATGWFERADWALWKMLAEGLDPGQMPRFGDYGIQHPVLATIDTPLVPLVPRIVYATDDSWLIIRGKDLRNHSLQGKPAYIDLCRELVDQHASVFMGAGYSDGDRFIDDCARGRDRCPNALPAWKRPCFVHHMTLVVRQLRSG